MSVPRTVRQAWGLVDQRVRRRFLLAAPLSLSAAVLEGACVSGIFAMVSVLASPAGKAASVFPLVGAAQPRPTLLLLGIAGLFVAKAALVLVNLLVQHKLLEKARVEFFDRVYRGLLATPYCYHIGRSSVSLIHQIRHRSASAYRVLAVSLVLGNNGLSALAILLILVATDWLVALSCLVMSSLVLWSFLALSRKFAARLGALDDELTESNLRALWEGLGAIQEVKVRACEQSFADAYRQIEDRQLALAFKRGLLQIGPRLLLEAAGVVLLVSSVGFLLLRRADLTASLPYLGMYAYAGMRTIPLINRTLDVINEIRMCGPVVQALVAERKVFIDDVPESFEVPMPFPLQRHLSVNQVSFRYPGAERCAVDAVSFRIDKGQWVGICGVTGSGKTTTFNLMAGLLQPCHGTIEVDGTPLDGTLARSWHAQIGFVPHTPYLFDQSLRRNVAFGVPPGEIDDGRVWEVLELAHVADLIREQRDGLETLIGERGIRLSAGERQRVALARALYHRPEILFLDEATSALDIHTERKVMRSIRNATRRATVVMIAHRLSTVESCDQILFFSDGHLRSSGTYEELMSGDELFCEMAGRDCAEASA